MSENDAIMSASQSFTSQSQSFLSQSQSVVSQSQRVNKLSRRGGRSHKKELAAPQPADLNTSDDFTAGLARCQSTSDSSSHIPEPERSSSACPDDLVPPYPPRSQCERPHDAAQVQAVANITPAASNSSVHPAETSGRTEPVARTGPTLPVPRPPQWKAAEVVGPSAPARKTAFGSTPASSDSVESSAAAASPVPPPPATDAQQTSAAPAVAPGPASPPAQPAPAPAGAAVLDCPVCLQPLASAATRSAHLRLCAERRGLSRTQLLAAVRLQERQTEERRAAGLPAVRTGAAKRTGAAARTRRRLAALPVAQDPDLQMALAVSASLQEEEQRRRCAAEQLLLEAGLEEEVVEQRRSLPEPPPPAAVRGLDMTVVGPAASRGRRGGRRRAAPVASELQRQTPEERQRRLCEKVAQLLAWEEEVLAPQRPLPPRRQPAGPAPLWARAAQTDTDQEVFYVPELAGRVQRCAAPVDSLLRDVAEIPGRCSLTQQAPPSEGSDSDGEETAGDPADSTQAALMMLAEESAGEVAPTGDGDNGWVPVSETSAAAPAAPDASLDRRAEGGGGTGRAKAGTSSQRPVSPDIFDDSGSSSEAPASALPCPLETEETEETQSTRSEEGRRGSLMAVTSPLLKDDAGSKNDGSGAAGPGEVPVSPELTAANCDTEQKLSASASSPLRTVVSDTDSAEVDDSPDAADSSPLQRQQSVQLRTAIVVCERIKPQSKTTLGDGAGAKEKQGRPRKSQMPQSQISPGGGAVVEIKWERHPERCEENITEVRENGVGDASEASGEVRDTKDSLGATGGQGRLSDASDFNESVTLGRRSTRIKIRRETCTVPDQELDYTDNQLEDKEINFPKQNKSVKSGRPRGRPRKHPVKCPSTRIKQKRLPPIMNAPAIEPMWKQMGSVRTYSKHSTSSVGTVGATSGAASVAKPEADAACLSDASSHEPLSVDPEGEEQRPVGLGPNIINKVVVIPPYSEPHTAPPGVCFRSEGGGGLGEALLQHLRDNRHNLPPDVVLLPCRGGFVAAHSCVLQARCPDLYAALPMGSRVPLLGLAQLSQQAVAALVELMYLGHVRCHDAAPFLCDLLMLAVRYGCQELADHVRQMHCGGGLYSSVALNRLPAKPRFDRMVWARRRGDVESERPTPAAAREMGGLDGQRPWNEDIPGYTPIRVGVACADMAKSPARGVGCNASPRSSWSVSNKHVGNQVETEPMPTELDIKPSEVSLLEHLQDVEGMVMSESVPGYFDTERGDAAATTPSAARGGRPSHETVSPTRSSPLRSTRDSKQTSIGRLREGHPGSSEHRFGVSDSSLSVRRHKSPVKKVDSESPTSQQDQPDVSSSFSPRSDRAHPAENSSSPRVSVSCASGSAGAGRQQRPPSPPAVALKRSNAVLRSDPATDDGGVLASPQRKRPRAGRERGEEVAEPSAGSLASSRDRAGDGVLMPGTSVGYECEPNNALVCDSREVNSPTKRQRESPMKDTDDSCNQENHPASSDGKVANSQLHVEGSARAGSSQESGAGPPSSRQPSADSDVQILDEEPEVFSQRAAAERRSASSAASAGAAAVERPSPPLSPLSQIINGDCPGPVSVLRGETTGSPMGGRDSGRCTGKTSSEVGKQRFNLSVKDESGGAALESPESERQSVTDVSKGCRYSTYLSEASECGTTHQREEYGQVVNISGDEGGSEDPPKGVGLSPGIGERSVVAAGADDVWEGFDDGGYIELLDPAAVSPPHLSKTAEPRGALQSQGKPDCGAVLEGPGPVSEPPQASSPSAAGGADDSLLWPDDSLLAACHTPATEKHGPGRSTENAPTQRRADHASATPLSSARGAGQTPEASTAVAAAADTPVNPYRVVLRESHTPRPNYVLMLTPELKEQLARIGVKPIPRRKAVALLSHIYEETHPPAEGAPPPAGQPANAAVGPRDGEPAPPRKKARRKPRKAGVSDNEPPAVAAREEEPASACSSALGDAADSDAESSSSDGAASRLEQLFQRLSDDEEEEDDVTPSQAATAADLPALVTSFIRARPDLHRQVLTYEPVWIERLLADLKLNGVKVKLRQLTDVLDEQCVTFRSEKTRCRQRRSPKKKRSPKKSAASKRSATQKKTSPVKPS